jgi:manganese efflux pump family protein
MSFVQIILIAVGLAMDASAVSLAAACSGYADTPRAMFRLAFHFGFFQFIMPVIGWYIGSRFVNIVSAFDHWVAFAVLVFLGAKMIRAGLSSMEIRTSEDPSRGWTLVSLSVATSIDALAVGLSLALLEVGIWRVSVMIGLVTMSLSVTAIIAGRFLGILFGKKMEVFGGTVLIVAGLRILIVHW